MKENKGKVILIIAILAIAAIIAYVCYGFIKGSKKPVATIEVSYIGEDGTEKTGTRQESITSAVTLPIKSFSFLFFFICHIFSSFLENIFGSF